MVFLINVKVSVRFQWLRNRPVHCCASRGAENSHMHTFAYTAIQACTVTVQHSKRICTTYRPGVHALEPQMKHYTNCFLGLEVTLRPLCLTVRGATCHVVLRFNILNNSCSVCTHVLTA